MGAGAAHADSTLLRANADKEGRVSRRLWEQLEHGLGSAGPAPAPEDRDALEDRERTEDRNPPGPRPAEPEAAPAESPARSPRAVLNNRLVSPTDPEAATHTRRGVGTMLGYRDHRLIDDRRGIITATHVTPADGDDGAQLPVLLDRMERVLGRLPEEAVGDSQYGTRSNYEHCGARGITPYLKKRRGRGTPRVFWLWLLPPCCAPGRALALMGRRRTVAEGSFAAAHTRHHHRRCRWRRRWRVQIQAYLVAAAQNLKKLIRAGRRRAADELISAAAVMAGAAARAARPNAALLSRHSPP